MLERIANTTSHEVLALDNAGTLSVFVGNFSSGPYGIEIVGDTLFCCAGGQIRGFLLSNAAPVFNLNLGATFLNGITHDNAGNLIATDFSSKAIYKVVTSAQTYTMIASNLQQSPNGICFDQDNNRCVFVNWGSNAPIKAIDMSTMGVTTITTTTLGNCDGITRDAQGRYLVSNWSGQSVVRFDSSFSSSPVPVVSGLSNPADICYDLSKDTLAIPNAGSNSVLFVGFPLTSVPEPDNITIDFYPNPVNEIIRFNSSSPIESYRIYNQEGRLQSENNFPGKVFNSEIDVTMLSPGIYFLVLLNEDKSYSSKISKITE